MNLIQRALLRFMPPEVRGSLSDPQIINAILGNRSAAGPHVSITGSLQTSAVFACVRVLAESVASLPLILYQKQPDGGKKRYTKHVLYPILHNLPNPELTSYEFRELLMGHLALWGNAYAEIERDRGGRIKGLWPLRPDRMEIERNKAGQIVYKYRITEGSPPITLDFERVMHIKGFGIDGLKGLSPIGVARQSVGLAMAAEEFGSRFFSNGARPGGVLEHPGVLGPDAAKTLRESWQENYGGLSNAHRVAILEEGMSFKDVGIPPQDAQYMELRKFQITDIARVYRVPPHMLADLERATFSNIEQQSIDFVTYTLHPWFVRWEQAISRDLIAPPQRVSIFAEHLADALLRGDIESRYGAYALGRQNGWLSANDIRRFENMDPIEDGDQYLVPLNMVPAGDISIQESTRLLQGRQMLIDSPVDYRIIPDYETRARAAAPGRQRLARRFERVIFDVVNRVMRREINDTRRAVKRIFKSRNAEQFREWLNDFYTDHKDFWVRNVLPLMLTYADQVGESVGLELDTDPRAAEEIRGFIDSFVGALASRQIAQSLGELTNVMERAIDEEEDPAQALEQRLDRWDDNRAGQIAQKETYMGANAFAFAFYGRSGVNQIIWVTVGENCPYCQRLDGRVVGLDEAFLEEGTEFQPEGIDTPLPINARVAHAPAHNGCDCVTMAA